MMTIKLFLFAFLTTVRAQYIELNTFTFPVLTQGVTSQLEYLIQNDFVAVNETLWGLQDRYKVCTDLVSVRLGQCQNCINENCQIKAQQCSVVMDKQTSGCVVSRTACKVIGVGKKALDILKKVKDKIKNGIKKIIGGIRLPRIRLPRIRLPRIRLPAIRLPRVRLPRIRLPRIRIRTPRIRLPRIRLRRGWGRRKRQSGEPSCEELESRGEEACLAYAAQCSACSGMAGSDELVLIESVCGTDLTSVFTSLQTNEERLIRLEDILDIANSSVFNITSIQFDPSQYDAASLGYTAVRVFYYLLGTSYIATMKDPVNPTNPTAAIPVISQLLFEELVPQGSRTSATAP